MQLQLNCPMFERMTASRQKLRRELRGLRRGSHAATRRRPSGLSCDRYRLSGVAIGPIPTVSSLLPNTIPTNLGHHRKFAPNSWITSMTQHSPWLQSLRKILPPTSCHQTVGGFYYILFVARSLRSSYQRYHPNNCSYAWPRHSCNHFTIRSWPTHRSSLI